MNTEDLIKLIDNNSLFNDEINKALNHNEIKKFTIEYICKHDNFDKSDLFDQLNFNNLTCLGSESDLFSEKSQKIDSDFEIDKNIINNKYKITIKISDEITIVAKNYHNAFNNNQIKLDRENKKLSSPLTEESFNRLEEIFPKWMI